MLISILIKALVIKNYEDTLKEFDNSIKIKHDCPCGYFDEGLIYKLLKGEDNLYQVVKNFDQTIKYDKNFSQAYYEKRYCQLELGNFTNAVESFNKCKQLSFEDSEKCESKINIRNNEINKLVEKVAKQN